MALTLYYLTDEGRIRKMANSFGLSHSSVSVVIRRVCHVIVEHLKQQLDHLPRTEAEVQDQVRKFSYLFHFPQCFGAVEGTNINKKQPVHNATDS